MFYPNAQNQAITHYDKNYIWLTMWYVYAHIIFHAMFDKNHCFNNWMNEPQVDFGIDPRMVWIIWGHVVTSCPCIGDIKFLQPYSLCHSSSEVHAGLWVALQGFMVAMSVLHVLACSKTWVNVAVVSWVQSYCQPS